MLHTDENPTFHAVMDAPLSFFFGLEKKQGQRRQFHSLLSETGQELTEPGLIRKRDVEFHVSLFKSEYKNNDELMEEVYGGLKCPERLTQSSTVH